MDPELISAYQRALYRITEVEYPFDIEVGQTSSKLDSLFESFKVKSGAFITAENPASVKLDKVENRERNLRLAQQLKSENFTYLRGFSGDKQGHWPREQSFLVLNILKGEAESICRHFKQYGFLWLVKQSPVELCLLNQQSKE